MKDSIPSAYLEAATACLSTNLITDRYSPIVVQGQTWSVDFVLRPVTKIKTTGIKPTEIEFLHAMQATNTPIYAAQALYVAACVSFDSK